MILIVDGRAMSHPQPGGFKTYTTGLVQALIATRAYESLTICIDRPMAAPVASPPGVEIDTIAVPDAVHWRVVPSARGWFGAAWREQVRMPALLRRTAYDAVHFPCNTAPLVPVRSLVLTLHDAIALRERRLLRPSSTNQVRQILMLQYNWITQVRAARRAARVITVSESAGRDLVTRLGVPEHKLRVIPNGYAPIFRPIAPASELDAVCAAYGIRRGAYTLALASSSPRKNMLGLLAIFARLAEDVRQANPLAMIVADDAVQPRLEAESRRLGVAGDVRFLRRVSDADMAALYNAASVFVFPSLAEGFGLPVLEAMACGAPTVATSLTSVPEVAGDGALLVDPRDETAFAAALGRVLTDEDLRRDLRERGLARAARFSWEVTARMTLNVYREAAAGGKS